MKRGCFVGVIVVLLVLGSLSLGAREERRFFVLDKGMRVLLQNRQDTPLINVALGIDLGAKDENPGGNGRVHLLEHLLLLGSTKVRSPGTMIKDLRAKGAYFNAHTDHDVMTLELSLPKENLDFALELLKEKMNQPAFKLGELEHEKQVIAREIKMLKEDPIKLGTTLALANLFKGHAYGNPVYGTAEHIAKTTIKDIKSLHENYLVPTHCSICLVGHMNLEQVEKKVRAIFESPLLTAKKTLPLSSPRALKKKVEIEDKIHNKQAYTVIGFQAPSLNHPDYAAMNVLVHILGRGPNPLLHRILGGKNRAAENVFVRYISLKHAGAVLFFLVSEPGKRKLAVFKTMKLLKRTSAFRYSKDDFLQERQSHVFDYLGSTINQIRYRSREAGEKGLQSAISNARYMLLREKSRTINYMKEIQEITAAKLREAAGKYFGRAKDVRVFLVPMKENK